MTRRRVKRTATANRAAEPQLDDKEKRIGNEDEVFRDPEVERQVTALRAICDMEIDHLLTGVRLLRSYFNEEQLQVPVLQFFEENLPNVSAINEGDGQVDLKWKHQEDNFPMHNFGTQDIHSSLLHRLSMGYPRFSEVWQPFSGFPLPGTAGNAMLDGTNILSSANHVLDDSYQSVAFGVQDGLHTPGVNGQRLSIGITPKTQRQPKHGEVLLSVHGSPLGVFKEDNNMESIVESEEG